MKRSIEWSRRAVKDLARIDPHVRDRIRAAVRKLAEDGEGDVLRLQGTTEPTYRLRVGDWRVIFVYDQSAILMLQVRPRGSAYKP